MKVFNIVSKVLLALVAVAGAVYVIATYGDKMVAWSRNLLSRCKCGDGCACDCGDECECGDDCECECGDECTCECACEEAAEEAAEVAEEADFEG